MYTNVRRPTDYQTPAKNVLNFCALALVWYIPEAWFSICLSIVGSGSQNDRLFIIVATGFNHIKNHFSFYVKFFH